MKLNKNTKIGLAIQILKALDLKADEVGIDTYSNCREQGFFLKYYAMPLIGYSFPKTRACSFSQSRNSDLIRVQYGVVDDFNSYGVFKSDDKYETNKVHFCDDDIKGASKFISDYLKGKKVKIKDVGFSKPKIVEIPALEQA